MPDSLSQLRRLVWLYFWFLLFEGALRKWLVPQLSSALLIVRDPIVIAIYGMAVSRGIFPRSRMVVAVAVLGLVCVAASFAGIGNLSVTLYGWRADFLHLPLIALVPHILRPVDVRRMGCVLLVVLPAMAALTVLQFKGGPTSHWNVGAGGQVGAQLYAAEGKVRASGTFSFSTGLATYLALCAAFLLHDLLAGRVYPRWIVLGAVPSLVLAVVVSGSRTAVISVAFVCAMVLYMALSRPVQFGAAIRPILTSLAAVGALMVFTPLFDEGLRVHQQRFATGGGFREGIIYRYANEFAGAWHAMRTAPLLGQGLGVGTNAGAALLRSGRTFLLGEGELERLIFESGPILGLAVIWLRVGVLIVIVRAAVRAFQHGRTLPLLLVGVNGVDMITGKFGQPTALGFAVFTAGLTLAAAKGDEAAPAAVSEPVVESLKLRGRSAYAERLHRSSHYPSSE